MKITKKARRRAMVRNAERRAQNAARCAGYAGEYGVAQCAAGVLK